MNRLRFVTAERLREVSRARLVSVLSGKGGVGKTVLALNLAERLASLGQKVLVIDADFTGGNVHILVNRTCHVGIGEFAGDGLALRECITPVSEGLDLLGMSNAVLDAEAWDARTAADLLDRVRREASAYDYVVLDHSSGKSKAATLLAHGSDMNLLVVVPELTSISDCYGLYKHLYEAEASTDLRLVINRAEDADEADYLHKKFGAVTERFIGRGARCIGFVLEDKLVRQAVAAQSPLAALNGNSVVVQSLTRIAQTLLRDLRPGPRGVPEATQLTRKVNPAEADIRE